MPNVHSTPLTVAALVDIDRLSFVRAGTILDEAKKHLGSFDYDLAVRRSQEAFELYLKSLFRFLQTEYPATHDLGKQVYGMAELLKPYHIESPQVARLVRANLVLTVWRSPAFYGDEKLNVGCLFDARESKLAIAYAESGQLVCGMVREYAYKQATA
jgi:hypothetical protein